MTLPNPLPDILTLDLWADELKDLDLTLKRDHPNSTIITLQRLTGSNAHYLVTIKTIHPSPIQSKLL